MRKVLVMMGAMAMAACSDEDTAAPTGGSGAAGTGAAAGASGAAGQGGTGGSGTSGQGGQAGAGGQAGVGGQAGASAGGQGGQGGAGSGGTSSGGQAGQGQGGSTAGAGGQAGQGGSAAGAGGSSGASGQSGQAGQGGQGGSTGEPHVFVGGYTDKIRVFRLDLASGALTAKGEYDAGKNPSFLAFHPTQPWLYAVNEGNPGRVLGFSIAPTDGALTPLNDASSEGQGPAHVGLDRAGKFALVANYGSGSIAVLPVSAGGQLSASVDTEQHGGQANAHQILTDPTNQFLYVPNKGLDSVSQYQFNPDTGALTPLSPSSLKLAKGAGCRHLDFHPTLPVAYVANELDDTVTVVSRELATGKLAEVQTLSTLESGVSSDSNTVAEVQVHPSGKFVYVSNRGKNELAIFAVGADGKLTAQGRHAVGKTPRHFQIDATGTMVVVANQGDGTVTTLRLDPATGQLQDTGVSVSVPSPTFAGIHLLPGG